MMKTTHLFIKAGAAGIHVEDQNGNFKKCGHMDGKVLISSRQFVNQLVAIRLQADMCFCPLVIVGRTDSLSAKLLDSNADPVDHPFILGVWDRDHPKDLKTFPDAGNQLLKRAFSKDPSALKKKLEQWNDLATNCSLEKAKKLADSLGFQLYFDWETPRTNEGFYRLKPDCVERTVHRAIEFAPYADLVWVETDKPSIKVAKAIAEGIRKVHPQKMLAYNLSPSFNWSASGLSKEEIKNFCVELGNLGFVFQFITLAGFHMNALISEQFSRAFAKDHMHAYVQNIQNVERNENVDQLKHQKWSGANLIDRQIQLVNQKSSVLIRGEGNTENQFH
jgi:isocitrate lyase